MSVTVPREVSERVPEHPNDLRIDAWFLCAEFVERVVSGARDVAARERGGDLPEVDWDAIWQTGDGAPNDEAAIGRIIRAAFEVARAIAPDYRPDVLTTPSPRGGLNGATALGATTLNGHHGVVDEVAVPVELAANAPESVVVHPEFLGNPPQPAQAEPAPTPTVEPMTETVVIAPACRSVSQW